MEIMVKVFSDPEAIAEDIIRDVGTKLVVGLPLGLGKANHIANALFARAVADRTIDLTFFSALTLEGLRTCLNVVSSHPLSNDCLEATPSLPMPTRCVRTSCRRTSR
jgi:hypothetical protein